MPFVVGPKLDQEVHNGKRIGGGCQLEGAVMLCGHKRHAMLVAQDTSSRCNGDSLSLSMEASLSLDGTNHWLWIMKKLGEVLLVGR